jgi:hypothetical protein
MEVGGVRQAKGELIDKDTDNAISARGMILVSCCAYSDMMKAINAMQRSKSVLGGGGNPIDRGIA